MSRGYKGGASALPAFGALMLAGAGGCAPEPISAPVIDRAWVQCTTDSECAALDSDTVLIGIGCGPGNEVSYALEEDQFPYDRCDRIERRRVVGNWPSEAGQ